MKWQVRVEVEDMAAAYADMKAVRALTKAHATPMRLPRVYEPFGKVEEIVKESLKNYKKLRDSIIDVWVKYCREKRLLWCLYLLSVPGFPKMAVLPLIAVPPQLAVDGYLRPSTYINVTLVPVKLKNGKISASLAAKTFYTALYTSYATYGWRQLRNLMEKVPSVYRMYDRNAQKYGEGARALKNTLRDVARLFAGHALLITAYYEGRRLKLYPEMAKHILQNPVNPEDLASKYADTEILEAIKLAKWQNVVEYP